MAPLASKDVRNNMQRQRSKLWHSYFVPIDSHSAMWESTATLVLLQSGRVNSENTMGARVLMIRLLKMRVAMQRWLCGRVLTSRSDWVGTKPLDDGKDTNCDDDDDRIMLVMVMIVWAKLSFWQPDYKDGTFGLKVKAQMYSTFPFNSIWFWKNLSQGDIRRVKLDFPPFSFSLQLQWIKITITITSWEWAMSI